MSRSRTHRLHQRRGSIATQGLLRYACEHLEYRRLLTSVVYLDFGDNFPVGGLQLTVQQMRNGFGAAPAGLQGPDLRQADNAMTAINEALVDGDMLTLNPTRPLVTFDYNGTGGVGDVTDYTDLRADVLTLVQRYYAPFDANVQIAPAVGDLGTSADYINDVRTQLQLGNNANGEYDSWVFISNVRRTADNVSIGQITGNFGVSNGSQLGGSNTQDNCEFAYADRIFGAATNTDIDTRLAYTAAHEAGHDFGLQHTNNGFDNNGNSASGNAQTDADMILQTGSNLVTDSAPAGNRTNFVFATRFPLVRGDGNTGGAFNINDTRNHYNNLANNNNLGLRAGAPAYVTGTGAFDEITITDAGGGMANVSLEAHRDTSFNNLSTNGSFSYSVPIANGILVEAGFNADRIIIDGDLAANVTVRGMAGNDQLIVNGNGVASGTYTPAAATQNLLDQSTSFIGQLTFAGGANIRVEEFETAGSITVNNVTSFTVITPSGADDLTVDSPAAGQMRVAGTSGGVGIIPLTFTSVGSVTIDTATNDGGSADDEVLLAAPAAAGLNSLAVNTGAGTDLLDINFASGNPIPAGGLSFNAGLDPVGSDLLNLRGGSFTNQVYTPSAPDSGTISLDGSVISYFNLAPINDTVVAATVTFLGTAGGDTINLIDSGSFNGFDTTQINSPSFELVNFANKTTVRVEGGGGNDVFNVSGSDPADGLVNLVLVGEADNDTFNLNNTFPGIATTAFGGTGADILSFNGPGAGAGGSVVLNAGADNDQINVAAAPSTPVTVSGGAGNDVLDVDGNGVTYALDDTTFTSTLATITYDTVERLDLADGTFDIATGVNVSTPLHVNLAATLTGVGTASGGVTANFGGVVSPGNAGPGVLGSGDLAFNGNSNYTLDLNGTGAGEHDELNVTGAVILSNLATLSATVGFLSIPGDEIVIIRNDGVDAVIGQFAGGLLLDFGGVKFTIDYGYDADGDLAFNDVALIRYGAQLAPDPCDPDEMALFVSSTSGPDDVRVVPGPGNAGGEAIINGTSEGVFDFKGHVYIMGQNGDDTVAVTLPAKSAFLYGNTGNDLLLAGNADSVLIGGFGNDTAIAGNGKDILIGGAGADVLEGGGGADVLIAGATTYDAVNAANRMSLCDIAYLWKTGIKPSSLSGLLNAATLITDNDADQLLGQVGKDFFLLQSADDTSDAAGNETVQEV